MPPGFYGFLTLFALLAIGGFLYQERNILFGEKKDTKIDLVKKGRPSPKNSRYPEEEYKHDAERE